jgi:hypothetical protein
MAANSLRKKGGKMTKYQFIVGVSLAALEEQVNRIVRDEPEIKLNQVFYAQGTGFVAVLECPKTEEHLRTEPIEQDKESHIAQPKAKKKS